MPLVSKTVEVDASAESIVSIVADFEAYPEWNEEIKGCWVLALGTTDAANIAASALGNMAIDAVINRDLPLIQGIVLVFALLFVLINLAVDMTYALLNPRLRHG